MHHDQLHSAHPGITSNDAGKTQAVDGRPKDVDGAAGPMPQSELPAALSKQQAADAPKRGLKRIYTGKSNLEPASPSVMPGIPSKSPVALSLSPTDIVHPKTKKRDAKLLSSAKPKKAKQGAGRAAVAQKMCPECHKIQPGARQNLCTCGHDFKAAKCVDFPYLGCDVLMMLILILLKCHRQHEPGSDYATIWH